MLTTLLCNTETKGKPVPDSIQITYAWMTYPIFEALKGGTRKIPKKASLVVPTRAEVGSQCGKGNHIAMVTLPTIYCL